MRGLHLVQKAKGQTERQKITHAIDWRDMTRRSSEEAMKKFKEVPYQLKYQRRLKECAKTESQHIILSLDSTQK